MTQWLPGGNYDAFPANGQEIMAIWVRGSDGAIGASQFNRTTGVRNAHRVIFNGTHFDPQAVNLEAVTMGNGDISVLVRRLGSAPRLGIFSGATLAQVMMKFIFNANVT